MPRPRKRKSLSGGEGLGELGALVVDGAEDLLELAGDLGELGDEVEGLLVGDGAAELREVEGEDEERGELGGEGLGAGDADLRAGVGGDGALRLAGDGGADDVADGEGLRALGDELALGGDGVGGLAGLGDEQADVGGSRRWGRGSGTRWRSRPRRGCGRGARS